MAPSLSKYLTKNNAYICLGLSASLWLISKRYKKRQRLYTKCNMEVDKGTIKKNRSEPIKPHVNLEFCKQLFHIIKIVIPGWTSVEAGYVLLVAAVLVVRTLCDLWLVHHISTTESLLISMEKNLFFRNVLIFLSTMPVLAVTNNLLKYATGELQIGMRKNLSFYLYKAYLKNLTYYRLSNLDSRIPNVDHLLTVDVEKFCDSLVKCYSNIAKPILDISIYTYKVSANISYIPPVTILGYMVVSGVLLANLRKPLGRLTVMEQTLEGQLRHVNARIATYGEEIAFYNGNTKEKAILTEAFHKLIVHARKFLHFRVIIGCIDTMVGKYCASFIGWTSFAVSLIDNYGFSDQNIEQRILFYYAHGDMLFRLAQAVGRLLLTGRELTHLASFTLRITELQQVFNDINEDKHVQLKSLSPNAGKVITQDNIIKFDKVPIVTPNGDVLIKELSVEICSGMNVLVCGPNGAGKSSIFRILGELWSLVGGDLTKPPPGKLFYVPQKPYMALGSLRDQITYPHSAAEAKLRGCTDDQLKHYLNLVQLQNLLEREDGLDAVIDWMDILSGGEKQRIAMARLFYHAPQFAILDECTSAVALDVENVMYSHCRKVGITLLTVSHRKSLWKHHEYVLYLDGRGSYTFNPIVEETEQFGS